MKKLKDMTKEEYREYNKLIQRRFRQRQKDTIARLRAENERLRAELKEMKKEGIA